MAEWIWFENEARRQTYGYFTADITGCMGKLRIAAETDCEARVNGKLVALAAFAGYPFEKYYDEYDISEHLTGLNDRLEITVRYEGVNSLTHIDDGAGLWFEAEGACDSGEDTLCCEDVRYVPGVARLITSQLGCASDMQNRELPALHRAVLMPRACRLLPRPVPRMVPAGTVKAVETDKKGLYDLGRETCGYVTLEADCPAECEIELAYGEHIADGRVRQKIGRRDFSLRFVCRKGINRFFQPFVRLAGRYIELHMPEGVAVKTLTVTEYEVPLTVLPHPFGGLDGKIYDTCVRTLRLCMHTHYEDCPWREQSLYVLDSRNQMLCGYEAFRETDFQRGCLVFMAKGAREDGMMELTFPAVDTPAIPFFSAMYPVEVLEYVQHTGDVSVIGEVWDRIRAILASLSARRDDTGLIENYPSPYWNFYEWSEGCDGAGELDRSAARTGGRHDLILNCAYILAEDSARELARLAGLEMPAAYAEDIRESVIRAFKRGNAFILSDRDDRLTRLGNAFAVLAGAGDRSTAQLLAQEGALLPETLSMAGFVYDALLKYSDEYAECVLSDIRKKYAYMLDSGATSFWETIKGEKDFDNAGSLCHGWSAIPIVYLKRLAQRG